LDQETADEVAALSALRATREQVELAVMGTGGRGDVRVAYELILDSKRSRQRAAEVAMAQQAAAATTPPAFTSSPSGSGTPSQIGTPPSVAIQQQAQNQQRAEQATAALTQKGGSTAAAGSPANQGRRRRWYLGIQSKKEPAHVMTEVYKALAVIGCEWHIIDSYRIKCRCRVRNIFVESTRAMLSPFGQPSVPFEDDGTGETIMIFLSLYKVQTSIYLLDFQKMKGNPFDFMTLCARIITELKALSQASRQLQQQALAEQQMAQQAAYTSQHSALSMVSEGQPAGTVPSPPPPPQPPAAPSSMEIR